MGMVFYNEWTERIELLEDKETFYDRRLGGISLSIRIVLTMGVHTCFTPGITGVMVVTCSYYGNLV